MIEKYIQQIASVLNIQTKQVNNLVKLNNEGATIPFIARYRKEATGNLDEVAIANVFEKISYFTDLEKRKETVINTIKELGKLTPELEQKINNCFDATVLEDIYLPYKPKRKTKGLAAIEKGLEALAKMIWEQQATDYTTIAKQYVNKEVNNETEALQGAMDIIAEWIAEHEQARNKIRKLFADTSSLSSKLLKSKEQDTEAQKYRDYFEFSEALDKCPSHRMLAIRRGEKEGFLSMAINIEKDNAIYQLEKIFITKQNNATSFLKLAITDSYTRLIKASIETEFRLIAKNKADEEAIKIFSENLRQLLLSAPLGQKAILAIDPGFKSGCKVVCLDQQGNLLHNTNIYPHPPQSESYAAKDTIKKLVATYKIEAIAIGNGTAGRETETLVRSIQFEKEVMVFQVNESGASIYSASEVARDEFPDYDVTVRGSISIGRRLLDPLSELVKIDAKSIGVGQYQHDVQQNKLKESLDRVVESCVNFVGVNLNTASKHLLTYVSGLSSTLAKNIVQYRTENGAFKNRNELKKVSLMGPKSFEQCAGFLRVPDAEHILDNSAVHPERYSLVSRMASDLGVTVQDLLQQENLRKQIDPKKYITEEVGLYTIQDILKELEKPGLDPRDQIEVFKFDEQIKSMEDLKIGMKVPGVVTNITAFGAFVDIGVKQDGLVHISQITNKFISDPNQALKLQQKVMVTITEVDINRKRIALSMKDNERRLVTNRNEKQHQNSEKLNENEMQIKLAALKMRFK